MEWNWSNEKTEEQAFKFKNYGDQFKLFILVELYMNII